MALLGQALVCEIKKKKKNCRQLQLVALAVVGCDHRCRKTFEQTTDKQPQPPIHTHSRPPTECVCVRACVVALITSSNVFPGKQQQQQRQQQSNYAKYLFSQCF